jgi:hypothetical protein
MFQLLDSTGGNRPAGQCLAFASLRTTLVVVVTQTKHAFAASKHAFQLQKVSVTKKIALNMA